MKFQIIVLNKTPLIIAIEKNNTDLAQLLLSQNGIDTNCKYIILSYIPDMI